LHVRRGPASGLALLGLLILIGVAIIVLSRSAQPMSLPDGDDDAATRSD